MAEKKYGGIESAGVMVLRVGEEYQLLSRERVAAGSRLFTIDGVLTCAPTRYSVQVGRDAHVDLSGEYGLEEVMDRFYWRFINHSCAPNTLFKGRALVALKSIEPGQEITFDYNSTEYELTEPFDCCCESDCCKGRIRGFRFLSRMEQERLRPWLADHLLVLLGSEGLVPSVTLEGMADC